MITRAKEYEFREWISAFAAFALVLPNVLWGASMPSEPERKVHEVTLAVSARLAESAQQLEADPDYVKTIVADLILPHFDFPSLAAATLPDHWDQLSAGEQRCVTNGIRERLVERYARVLLEYEYTSIVTDSLGQVHTSDPVYVTQTAMTPHPEPLSIQYKMEFIDKTWKVVDLIVADVSLVKSYRVSFAEDIDAVGIGDFLRTFPECRER
jgi:phospholipid transport system substrate-binding protein